MSMNSWIGLIDDHSIFFFSCFTDMERMWLKSTKIQIGFALFVEEFVTVVFAGMQKDGHPLGISIERLIPLISCP
jgi:hypothetical protein